MSLRDIFLSLLVALLITAVGALGWQLMIWNRPISAPPEQVDVHNAAVLDSVQDSKAVAQYVSDIHDKLNTLACYTEPSLYSAEGAGWLFLKQNMSIINGRLESIKPLVEAAAFLEDIDNLSALLNIALEQKEYDALVYAHRIIHDLDYYVFKSPLSLAEPSDNWGATVTLEGLNSSAKRWLDARR